ncbi:MAG: hypothetical protein ACI3XP_05665 [Eubacteriales bacterium]
MDLLTYFRLCVAAFCAGLLMLAGGMLFKNRLKPGTAAVLILAGAVVAMVFMNLSLILYATLANR